jgi:SAM-dependent methyltransferase
VSEPAELFGSAVQYYARYRSGYPDDLVADLASRTGLDGTQTVLDIGCGTGQLAIPLARYAHAVLAIDPVPGMLAQGRLAAEAAGVTGISWLAGTAGDVPGLASRGAAPSLASFAASFHWTEREAVLTDLDRLLVPSGAVVVLNDVLEAADEPDWDRAIAAVRDRYLPAQPPLPGARGPMAVGHREVLGRSAFSVVERLEWAWSRQLTVDQVTGLQLSYSFSTPALLDAATADFCRDVRAAVLDLHPDGLVTEPFRVEVLIARRPD